MIAIDWGTSNFRAFRLNASGEIIEKRSSAAGILRMEDGLFEEALLSQIGDWLRDGEDRILLCGMVGSRQGWVETAYVPCPVTISDLAKLLVPVPFQGAQVLLVPGVIGEDVFGVPEVMRGEETEAMGVLEDCAGDGLVCVPGTHSKWVELSSDSIRGFTTSMTGDVFAAVRGSTILSRIMTMDNVVNDEAFLRGVARSANSGGLLHHLFSVRTLALTNQLKQEACASYLSGLLIGHEVRASMPEGAHVHLVGTVELCFLYARAIAACGGSSTVADENAAARGLAAIGRRLTWI